MRELLEAVASGELTPRAAESEIRGYVTGSAGRFDATRERRRGVPEAVLAEGKTPTEVAELVELSLETTDRAIVTRIEQRHADAVRSHLLQVAPEATVAQRRHTLYVTAEKFEPPTLDASVVLVSAGTADGPVAEEAAVVLEDAGVSIDRIEDVGVAALDRLLDQLDRIREADVVVVFAGREGALPTVVAGLVDAPVIGVPVSAGYGVGGDGEAALQGMLQSCTVLSVVNVDAGFVAGAQATLIARAIVGE